MIKYDQLDLRVAKIAISPIYISHDAGLFVKTLASWQK